MLGAYACPAPFFVSDSVPLPLLQHVQPLVASLPSGAVTGLPDEGEAPLTVAWVLLGVLGRLYGLCSDYLSTCPNPDRPSRLQVGQSFCTTVLSFTRRMRPRLSAHGLHPHPHVCSVVPAVAASRGWRRAAGGFPTRAHLPSACLAAPAPRPVACTASLTHGGTGETISTNIVHNAINNGEYLKKWAAERSCARG